MKNEIIHIIKRNVFDFQFVTNVFAFLVLSGPISLIFKYYALDLMFKILFACFILSIIVFVCGGIVLISSANSLLKDGNVIWATVDLDMLHFDGTILSVYCFEEKEGRKIYYKGTSVIGNKQWGFDVKSLLTKEGIIPVVVDPDDSERYIVLLKEIVDMFYTGKNKRYRTDVIRGITWPKDESGR